MKPQQSIGLYGGSFDPIHFGHLNLALEIMEKCGLAEVWFIPASHSPLKSDVIVPAEHRLKMINLAVEGIDQFRSLSLEIERPGPSYTIDTVKNLVQQYAHVNFYLILGEDSLLMFDKWKSNEELCQLVPLLIGCRNEILLKERIDNLPLTKFIKKKIHEGLIETALMDISATTVRDRLKKKLYCGHLIPSKVLDYIYQYQLYC